MKASVKKISSNEVSVSLDGNYYGTYSVRPGVGGYVRDENGNQVCERLGRRGYTLQSTPDNLAKVIRREALKFARDLEYYG